MRFIGLALICSCAIGEWNYRPAQTPLTHQQLEFLKVTVVGPPELAELLKRQGFDVVSHPPYHQDLELRLDGGVGTLRSDGYFVEEVRGTPEQMAEQLARSSRVASFFRDSGLPQQRDEAGM